MPSERKPFRSHNQWFGLATLVLLFAAAAAARLLPDVGEKAQRMPGYTFLAVAGLLAAAAVCAGIAVRGRYSGVIIDGRGRYSLSRLQALAWTILVLAGLSVAIGTNIARNGGHPGDVALPGELIALMGISGGAAVFAQTIKSINGARGTLFVNEAATTHEDASGKVVVKGAVDVQQARISDLIQGEAPDTKDLVDVGKLQNLYFTIIVLSIYGWLVWQTLVREVMVDKHGAKSLITSMPSINEALIALILISHAGYLTLKAIPSEKPAEAGPAKGAANATPAVPPEDQAAKVMGGKG